MTRVFIGVGSNIDPERNVCAALLLLGRVTRLVALSTFYRTEPLERPEHPFFYNGVAEIETMLSPEALKYQVLREIEQQFGRRRCEDRSAPRPIDLDILLYDDLIIRSDDLHLPDPDIPHRPFLALPLYELHPELVLPGSGRKLREIVLQWEDTLQPLTEFSARLRKDCLHEQTSD